MASGLELLRGTRSNILDAEVEDLDRDVGASSGLSLLRQSTVKAAPDLAPKPDGLTDWSKIQPPTKPEPKGPSDTVLERVMEAGVGMQPPREASNYLSDQSVTTLKGLESLGNTSYELVRGTIDFGLSVPGFALGLLNAVGKIGKEIIDQIVTADMPDPLTGIPAVDITRGIDLNRMYEVAAEAMGETMEFFQPGKELITGAPSELSQMPGQVAMAPLTGLSMLGHKVASYFEGYPNVQGAAKFIGDIVGLIAMGMLLHGGRGKAEIAREMESVVKKADEIINIEEKVKTIPNDLVRSAQEAALKIQKKQLDLRAKKVAEKIEGSAELRADLDRMVEETAKEKALGKSKKLFDKKEREIEKARKEMLKEKKVVKGKKVKAKPAVKVEEPTPEPITEVDQQTGTEVPGLEGTKSPFFQSKTKTNRNTKLLNEREKAVTEDIELYTQKLVNDVNRWYHGDETIDIDLTRESLSGIATEAESFQRSFMLSEDHLIWKEAVSEAAKWARELDRTKIDQTKAKPETKLYSGLPLDELISKAHRVSDYTKKAREMKTFKPKEGSRLLKEELVRSFIDRSGNIRLSLLESLGEAGYRIVQRMYLAKGASSQAVNELKQMRKEINSGLSRREKIIRDSLVLADRMVDIAGYKTAKQFKFPKDIAPADFAIYSELFEQLEKITPEKAAKIRKSAKAYFEWMKKPLKAMLDAELITEQEYNDLASHKYRRTKLVDVFDKKHKIGIGKRKRTIYDSGVEPLARGRETDIYEPSSEVMALEVFNRAYGRIMNNRANLELLDLAKKDPTNPFVRIKEDKGKLPSGWTQSFVYKKGERKTMYLSPEMSREWITSSPEMTYRMSQFIRMSSGSPVLRTFATGINWGFALANLPRDVMHTWYAARKFEDGKWKGVYSPHAPVFAAQIGRDLATTFTDALLRKGRYKAYLEEGGGMEFLVHQGRILQRGRHIEGPIDAFNNFMGYFGETSEIMTRLAIRERMLRQGKSASESTFAARDYMDFGQGGGIGKAVDNGIPYLNAAIQGTRGMFRAFKDNPVISTYKLAQFAAVTAGLYIAMRKMHPASSKALEGNIDMQNNIVIPLGDQFGFVDSEGQTRYPYIKIPLDPGQKFFKVFFEASADKWLGNDIDVNRVVDSLKELSPVGVTELPPTVSGALGYLTNKDFWMNEDIWRKTEPFKYPKSKEEFIPGQTPQVYEDFGEVTGLSPERTKYVVEELTTSGTVWSYLLGQGYDALRGLPKDQREQHLAHILSKIPIIKRFFGITNPYSQFARPIDKAEEKNTLEIFIQNRTTDTLIDGYLYGDSVTKQEVDAQMRSFKDVDVYDRLVDRFMFRHATKGLPNRGFWLRLKGLAVKPRAEAFFDRMEKATPEEAAQIGKEWRIVDEAGGVITNSFMDEVDKLRSAEK